MSPAMSLLPKSPVQPRSLASSSDEGQRPKKALEYPSKKNRSQRLFCVRSVGLISCFILIGGSLMTFLALSYLVFLWRGYSHESVQTTNLWRIIVLHGWATQSVTLTTAVLRTISAAQTSLCISFVAALLLETRGVPVSQAAHFSITRVLGSTGEAFKLMLRMMRTQQGRSLILTPETLVASVLVLTSLAMQFSSTILVSDFGSTRLTQSRNYNLVNVAMSPAAMDNVGDYLTFGDPASSTVLFGELDSQNDPMPTTSGVSDTGVRRRVFLPYEKDDRLDLQSFSGATFTFDTRPGMTGAIEYNQTLLNGGLNRTASCFTQDSVQFCLPEVFNLTIPITKEVVAPAESPAAIYHLQLNPDDGVTAMPLWDQESTPFNFTAGSWAHLVLVTNVSRAFWNNLSDPLELGSPLPSGEWSSYELAPSQFLNLSLCFSGLDSSVSNLTVTGHINQSEPLLPWITQNYTYDTTWVQNMMGSTMIRRNTSERGIFSVVGAIQDQTPLSTLEVDESLATAAISDGPSVLLQGPALNVWQNSGGTVSVGMCNQCTLDDGRTTLDIAALFQRIIHTTGRPGIAIDAFLTMVTRSWYYVLLPMFDIPGFVETSFSTTVLLPVRWGGLIAVLVLVVANLVSMWTVTFLYIENARFTRIGNFWQAAAQLVSSATLPILREAVDKSDRDIFRILKKSDDFMVHVGEHGDKVKAGVVYYEPAALHQNKQ
ncbi:hypothetical protein F5Y16DRAFT_404123 [Xylariaceae sp. FL0255]|nr:hypothetical protein F5Y16DRAFT_404123 [Xylariaceae sp. FL0255]